MGRLARVIAVGVTHHVTQRCNGHRILLDSDADRGICLELLQENLRLHEVLLDPLSVALSNAPMDDEPVSEEEARDIAEACAAYARGEVVSNPELLADFGLTAEDFERMGRTPLDAEPGQ